MHRGGAPVIPYSDAVFDVCNKRYLVKWGVLSVGGFKATGVALKGLEVAWARGAFALREGGKAAWIARGRAGVEDAEKFINPAMPTAMKNAIRGAGFLKGALKGTRLPEIAKIRKWLKLP